MAPRYVSVAPHDGAHFEITQDGPVVYPSLTAMARAEDPDALPGRRITFIAGDEGPMRRGKPAFRFGRWPWRGWRWRWRIPLPLVTVTPDGEQLRIGSVTALGVHLGVPGTIGMSLIGTATFGTSVLATLEWSAVTQGLLSRACPLGRGWIDRGGRITAVQLDTEESVCNPRARIVESRCE